MRKLSLVAFSLILVLVICACGDLSGNTHSVMTTTTETEIMEISVSDFLSQSNKINLFDWPELEIPEFENEAESIEFSTNKHALEVIPQNEGQLVGKTVSVILKTDNHWSIPFYYYHNTDKSLERIAFQIMSDTPVMVICDITAGGIDAFRNALSQNLPIQMTVVDQINICPGDYWQVADACYSWAPNEGIDENESIHNQNAVQIYCGTMMKNGLCLLDVNTVLPFPLETVTLGAEEKYTFERFGICHYFE